MGTTQESKDQYRQLFDCHPHAILVYDLETLRFLAVNAAAIALYGYSRDEFLALTIKDLHSPGDPSIRVSDPEIGIYSHCAKNGSFITLEIDSRDLSFDGRPARLLAALGLRSRELSGDNTDEPRLDVALRLSEERYENIINNVEDGYWETDLAGNLTFFTNQVMHVHRR